jgi:hypothetical protein
MGSIGIIILATNKYFALGLRLMHRIKHFYKGSSNIYFHFFSDKDPHEYIGLKNIVYHKVPSASWYETVLFKFNVIKEVAENENYDYFVYVDADSNLYNDFKDEDFVSKSFILKHFLTGVKNHYEQNELSSAYINPSEYPEFYYHSCYFGGSKKNILELTKTSIDLSEQDAKKGITAYAEDESYINKYFSINPPEKIFDFENSSFPFIGDKGILANDWGKHIEVLFTEKEYQDMLAKIKTLRDKNILWDIKNSRVV